MIKATHDKAANRIYVNFSDEHFNLGQSCIVNFDRGALPSGIRMTNDYPDDSRDNVSQVLGHYLDPVNDSKLKGRTTRIVFFGDLSPENTHKVIELVNDWVSEHGEDFWNFV